MLVIRSLYLVVFFLVISCPAQAQQAEGDVVIHADPRLDILLGKKSHAGGDDDELGSPRTPVVIYSGKGYRVQIYNGTDREKALEVKTEFMRKYPAVHTYLSYLSPTYRVKVGDYRFRLEAEKMLNEVSGTYSRSMIVPDKITITELQPNQD
jgi:hypothetical protein